MEWIEDARIQGEYFFTDSPDAWGWLVLGMIIGLILQQVWKEMREKPPASREDQSQSPPEGTETPKQ